jgi:hypothetical protein
MPNSPEHEARRKQLEHDLHQANLEKSASVAAEHEENRQQVLKQLEDAAVAKFTALIPTFTENISAALDALGDLAAVRGLTTLEKNIMWNLIQLDTYRLFPKPITL